MVISTPLSDKYKAEVYRTMGYVCGTLPCALTLNFCLTADEGFDWQYSWIAIISVLFIIPAYYFVNVGYNVLLELDKEEHGV